MAIFRLTESQPTFFVLPDENDERSAAALASILTTHDIPFHIFADDFQEELEPFADHILDDISSAPFRPQFVIDCTLVPIPTPNPYVLEIAALYPSIPLLAATPNFTAAQLSAFFELKNVARLNLLPGLFPAIQNVECTFSPAMSLEVRSQIVMFFRDHLRLRLETIEDIVGFVVPRVLAMLANEGAFAVMEGVSSAAEIDEAMRLGTNYPKGPLEWADHIGLDVILSLLDALFHEYKQERYRACRLLRQYVAAGWTGERAGKGFYAY